MNVLRKFRFLAGLMSFWIALYPAIGIAEDIDIFVGSSAGTHANPNVLIVLDNTSNWARQSQQWPGGLQQGQSEANAINTVINTLGNNVNIGLMEFVTGGTANDDGGFARFAVRPMTDANKAALSTKLTTIYGGVTSSAEKRNSNTPYGDLMYDVYNYYAGLGVSSDGHNGTRNVNPPNADADAGGYSSAYTAFQSPLSSANSCARNFQIFIGNPNASGPASDSSDNTAAMNALGCNSSPLSLPTIGSVPTTTTTTLGNTASCYASLAATQTAYGYGLNTTDNINQLYVNSATAAEYRTQCAGYTQGCTIGAAATTTNPMACPSGTSSYHVIRTGSTTTTSGPTAQTPVTTSAATSTCYATAADAVTAVAGGDHAGLTCPVTSGVQSTVGDTTTTTTTTHSCTYALGAVSSSCTGGTNLTASGTTTSCYASSSAANTAVVTNGTDHGGMTCPSGYSCNYAVGAQGASCSGTPGAASSTTTSCYASTPAVTSPATSSSVATAATLTCPSGYSCNYVASNPVACTTPSASSSTTTSCYAAAPTFSNPATSSSVATTTALNCPSGYTCDYAASAPVACSGSGVTTGATTSYYSSTPSITSPASSSSLPTSPSLSCPGGATCTYSVGSPAATLGGTSHLYSYNCYSSAPSFVNPSSTSSVATQGGTLNCPANSSCTYTAIVQGSDVKDGNSKTCGATGSTNPDNNSRVYQITQTVSATQFTVTQTAAAGSKYTITQTPRATTANSYTITQTPIANYAYAITQTAIPQTPSKYMVIQTDTPSVSTSATTVGTTDLGQTSGCFASPPGSTSDYADQCTGTGVSCTYNTGPAATTNHCATGSSQYLVQGQDIVYTNGATGTSFADTQTLNADEWARCLYQKGIPVAGGSNQSVTTYTIDVYNKQPNNMQTSLLLSMARNGGGKYFSATNEAAIAAALKQIMAEIQSINSTFASASLPINATNRAQNENQVFIGMFRPDPDANPRWFGNVKRYQLIKDSGGDIQLGDVKGNLAINGNTGFITDCAMSWWTTDSSAFWQSYPINPNPVGTCTTSSYDRYSDAPDGPSVEKGAVAEIIRLGNNPPSAPTNSPPTYTYPSPTFDTSHRTMYTANSTGLIAFSAANTGLSDTSTNWVLGQDTQDENANGNFTETRASLHGDVVHSRPLPVNYCTTANCSNVIVYYGANDGTLRAISAATGTEKWAFVAPEFISKLDRLRTQSPAVCYPNTSNPDYNPITGTCATATLRDYFFDGSIGLYQTASNDKVWIFPTMRRGGRMVYALDVTNVDTPILKWKYGCNDAGCSTGASAIGQTWSIPNVAFIKGYSTTTPVAVIGGGYDSCEDANTSAPSCAGAKGNVVYVVNANTGAFIQSFATLHSVAGDVALIDMDLDGKPDYGYVTDTGGNIYRISFSTYDNVANTYTALDKDHWTITPIASTSGAGRKFLFTPALFGGKGTVYVAVGSGDREHPLQTQYPYTTFNGGTIAGINGSRPIWNRFYVYRDCLSATPTSPDDLDSATSMTDATTDTTTDATTGVTTNTGCKRPPIDNCGTNKGWFVDLKAGSGEQTVTSAVITGGMVTFSTNRPIPASAGTCSTPLGEARGYWLNLYNGAGAVGVAGNCGGTKSSVFVGGGLPPSPVIGTVPINGVLTSVVLGAVQRSGVASSPISPQKATPTNLPARKRVYSYTKGD